MYVVCHAGGAVRRSRPVHVRCCRSPCGRVDDGGGHGMTFVVVVDCVDLKKTSQ